METTGNSPAIPSNMLILIALVQGFVLLLLHQSIEFEFWPHNQPQWLFSFYAVAFAVPVMLLLGLSDRVKSVYKWTAIYGVMLFGLGYYIGLQASPMAHIDYWTLLSLFIATLTVATFKSLMYIQHFAAGGPLTYSRLFLLSWRNFLTLGLSLLFTASTWGVLMLWAALFNAIEINFFHDLFTERWFYYPVLALANGFGVIIFRYQASVIDTITRIQQALMKFLLVILALVSVIFLCTLLATGLSPLWESGGSLLILWMQALMLFFINAVYQDDPEAQPYHLWVHRLIYIGVALLPIYSAISFYGLSLRVEQYGWSVSRCWAFLLWAVFAAFSVGYLWGILRLKDHWLRMLSWINVRMGLVVLALMLVVNSPLLDFRKIAVNSQIERLEQGVVSLDDFDYRYLRRQLAAPGYQALKTLQAKHKETRPDIALRIDQLYTSGEHPTVTTKENFIRAVDGITENTPEALVNSLYEKLTDNRYYIKQFHSYRLHETDLNNDGNSEYVFFAFRQSGVQLTMYYQSAGQWQSRSLRSLGGKCIHGKEELAQLMEALENSEVEATTPKWQHFKVGEFVFQVE